METPLSPVATKRATSKQSLDSSHADLPWRSSTSVIPRVLLLHWKKFSLIQNWAQQADWNTRKEGDRRTRRTLAVRTTSSCYLLCQKSPTCPAEMSRSPSLCAQPDLRPKGLLEPSNNPKQRDVQWQRAHLCL